jgi:hypothetical protein
MGSSDILSFHVRSENIGVIPQEINVLTCTGTALGPALTLIWPIRIAMRGVVVGV